MLPACLSRPPPRPSSFLLSCKLSLASVSVKKEIAKSHGSCTRKFACIAAVTTKAITYHNNRTKKKRSDGMQHIQAKYATVTVVASSKPALLSERARLSNPRQNKASSRHFGQTGTQERTRFGRSKQL